LFLVDTSIWIEVFRKPPGLDLEAIVPFEEIATCLPVLQEVLQGFRSEGALQLARESLLALPVVESPLRSERFLEAAQIYRAARAQGVTVRSSVDCLIAACALTGRADRAPL
jgi:predicted nucleic acid-binding protein